LQSSQLGQQGSFVPFKRGASPETNEERRRDVRIYRSNLDVEQASLGSSWSRQAWDRRPVANRHVAWPWRGLIQRRGGLFRTSIPGRSNSTDLFAA